MALALIIQGAFEWIERFALLALSARIGVLSYV